MMKASDVNVITVDWSKGNGYLYNFLFFILLSNSIFNVVFIINKHKWRKKIKYIYLNDI